MATNTPAATITKLRDAGIRVKVRHIREPLGLTAHELRKLGLGRPNTKGGGTLVYLSFPGAESVRLPPAPLPPAPESLEPPPLPTPASRPPRRIVVLGYTRCHRLDTFNRRLGLAKALGKAIQEAGRQGFGSAIADAIK